jgi:rSAM/selenodomain-associated transferase 1
MTQVTYRTIPPPQQRLLLFARVPELGRVKTRLAAAIGEERALAVYEAMLHDVLESIGGSTEEIELEVVWAPTEIANGDTLVRAFGDRVLAMQTGATLGDRLSMAFSERFFFHRTMKIVAIGVDDPSLGRNLIDRAFDLLDSCEWVIGPATDGGYYLIGCRAPSFETNVFRDVEWGTSTVFADTIRKIRGSGASIAVLPLHSDIDYVNDLRGYQGGGALGDLLRLWSL